MARAVSTSAPLSGRRLYSEHAGLVEGSCVTSRRFHEAVLRVIDSPAAGATALYHHGQSSYKSFPLVHNPDGGVVCTA
jgi:hypothetical protein